jgi:hypothetical protein
LRCYTEGPFRALLGQRGQQIVAALAKDAPEGSFLHGLRQQFTHVEWAGFRFYDFIFPLFLLDGKGKNEPIKSLPGIARLSDDNALRDMEEAGLEEIPISFDDVIGGIPAHDIVDPATGEVLVECNGTIKAETFEVMREKGIDLSVTEAFKERLVEEGYNPSSGARPLRRAVMRLLEDSLAEEFLSGRIGEGDAALVDVNEEKQVVILKQATTAALPELAGAGA